MKVIREKIKNLDRPKKIVFFTLVVVYFVLFYSYIYNDILETTKMGIVFWEKLFSGQIRFFYDGFFQMNPFAYTKEVQGVYDFPIYILFGIWDFPLYLLSKFTNIDVFNSFICLAWSKTILLVFVLLLMSAMNKLARKVRISDDDCFLLDILFLTSAFFMTAIIIDCAYDIISLYFAILGIEAWMNEDKKRFIIFFMCAIPLKFFSLLLFVPLLLLREKRILRIIGYSLLSILPILIFRILIPCSGNGIGFRLSDIAHGTDLSNLALLYAITNFINLGIGETYFSVLGWVILFALCYFIKPKNSDQYKTVGIYVCFLSYLVLFITCYSHPYWLLIIMPFVHLIMVKDKEILHVNLILEMVFSCTMIVSQMVIFPWCFGNAPASGMFWHYILGRPSEFNQFNVITIVQNSAGSDAARKLSTGVSGMGTTVFIAGLLLFAVINFPKEFGWKQYLYNHGEKAETWGWIVRQVASLGIGLIPLVFYALSV